MAKKNDKLSEPVFRESVEKKNGYGETSSITTISLIPWVFVGRDEKSKSGYTCQIKVSKIGSLSRAVFIDPANEELRDLISRMYQEYDKRAN